MKPPVPQPRPPKHTSGCQPYLWIFFWIAVIALGLTLLAFWRTGN